MTDSSKIKERSQPKTGVKNGGSPILKDDPDLLDKKIPLALEY